MKMHEKALQKVTGQKFSASSIAIIAAYVALVLLIFYCYYAFSSKTPAIQKQQSTASAYSKGVNFDVIPSFHLFGINDDPNLRKLKDSHIELVGIIFKDKASKAIILINSKEQVLSTGDKIDNNYSIHKIEPSRVIISTSNGLEELGLFDTLEQRPANSSTKSQFPQLEEFSQQEQPLDPVQLDNLNNLPKFNNIEPRTGRRNGNF